MAIFEPGDTVVLRNGQTVTLNAWSSDNYPLSAQTPDGRYCWTKSGRTNQYGPITSHDIISYASPGSPVTSPPMIDPVTEELTIVRLVPGEVAGVEVSHDENGTFICFETEFPKIGNMHIVQKSPEFSEKLEAAGRRLIAIAEAFK